MSALIRDTIAVYADIDRTKVIDFADEMQQAGWKLESLEWNDNNCVATLTKAPKKKPAPRRIKGRTLEKS